MNINSVNSLQVKSLDTVQQVKIDKSSKAVEADQKTTEEKKPYTSYDLTNMTGQEVLDLSHQMLHFFYFYIRRLLAIAVYCLSQ